MRVFAYKNGHLVKTDDPKFKEDELHSTVESNLSRFFPGLDLVKSEFWVTTSLRIDTLAYDHDRQTFVIIEYKKDNKSMTEQISEYDEAVKENKERCLLTLNNTFRWHKDTKDIKWKNTRMFFIKPDFTESEIKFSSRTESVELCAVRKYSGGWIVHHLGNEHKYRSRRRIPQNTGGRKLPTSGGLRSRGVHQEPKQYSEDDYFAGKYGGVKALPSTKNLYLKLKKAILTKFPNIIPTQTLWYVGFSLKGGKMICTVRRSKQHLILRYKTNRVDSLPVNAFVKGDPDNRHGCHHSKLLQESDISLALEYVDMLYRQQNAGRITKVNKGAGKQNDRSLDTNTDSLLRRAGASIDIVLQDGKEHKTQEIRNHLHNALENEGIVIHALKITNAVNSKLHSLKNAGKITNSSHA